MCNQSHTGSRRDEDFSSYQHQKCTSRFWIMWEHIQFPTAVQSCVCHDWTAAELGWVLWCMFKIAKSPHYIHWGIFCIFRQKNKTFPLFNSVLRVSKILHLHFSFAIVKLQYFQDVNRCQMRQSLGLLKQTNHKSVKIFASLYACI